MAAGAALAVMLGSSLGVADELPVPSTVPVPAGPFIYGSDPAEREYAYQLDEAAYGHSITRERKWYENEPIGMANTGAYRITETPITNSQYAAFVRDAGHPWPEVDAETWRSYRLIHPYERTRRHAWPGPTPPPGRGDHPVVMVSHSDAVAFAEWLSAKTGLDWRLPSEAEWEKAARGSDGRYFPWGDTFEADRLNSHDIGPFDTTSVGSFPTGASPYGVLDAAGQVYEWTATAAPNGRYIVKGGSWDDSGCGVCRAAGRHGRPADIKHILIGFRLVLDGADSAE